jgi:hypothetical protein
MDKWIEHSSLKMYTWPINNEDMFNIINHKQNANQNDIEIPSHPINKNGYHQEHKQQQMSVKSPHTLLVGMQISSVTVEISMEIPDETKKNTAIILSCYTTPVHIAEGM